MNLKPIAPYIHDLALQAWEHRDMRGMLHYVDSPHTIELVHLNIDTLRMAGLLEEITVLAWINSRTKIKTESACALWREVFDECDRDALWASGDRIPEGMHTLYRGVAGTNHRRENGFSWTADRDTAEWFASRYYLENPTVLERPLDLAEVLFYTNQRREQEFVLDIAI